MPAPVLVATPGAANANSFLTVVEASTYFTERIALAPKGWGDSDEFKETLLIMATRLLVRQFMPLKQYFEEPSPHYLIARTWTGSPATTTQKLSWPRLGMTDVNGNAIPSNVIPDELKQATAELAGQLGGTDRTLDNDVIVQGITSIRAGSVALTFKENFKAQVIPDAVLNLLLPSWFTDVVYEPAMPGLFDVVSD